MDESLVKRFEGLVKKREDVRQELSRLEGQLQEIGISQETLEKELQENYGTSDLELLSQKVKEAQEKIVSVMDDVDKELIKIESINNVS